jgi:hypothetical protein
VVRRPVIGAKTVCLLIVFPAEVISKTVSFRKEYCERYTKGYEVKSIALM